MQNKCLPIIYHIKEKRDSNTGLFLWNLWNVQEQWSLLLLLPNKKLHRAYISHLQRRPFTLLHLLLTWWWGMRFEHDVTWIWEERVESRNMCLKQKEVLLMVYYIRKNWSHYIKDYLEYFQNLLFKKLLAQSGDQTDIFWRFYSPADTLVTENHRAGLPIYHFKLKE